MTTAAKQKTATVKELEEALAQAKQDASDLYARLAVAPQVSGIVMQWASTLEEHLDKGLFRAAGHKVVLLDRVLSYRSDLAEARAHLDAVAAFLSPMPCAPLVARAQA